MVTKINYRKNKNGVLIGTFRTSKRGNVSFTGNSRRSIRKKVTKYDFK
jgi:hypothetical protein